MPGHCGVTVPVTDHVPFPRRVGELLLQCVLVVYRGGMLNNTNSWCIQIYPTFPAFRLYSPLHLLVAHSCVPTLLNFVAL